MTLGANCTHRSCPKDEESVVEDGEEAEAKDDPKYNVNNWKIRN